MPDGSSGTTMFWLAAAALCCLAATTTNAARIESISATMDRRAVRHENFVPLVAFRCGYRNKYMNTSGEWTNDPSSAAVCLEGKLDILKYCKRVYPDRKITNIVEYSHISHTEKWCKENGRDCRKNFYTRPYRCIEGEFIADSLQVPSKCKFGHVSGRDTCDDYQHWSKKASSQCQQNHDSQEHKSMRLHSFAMLEPCGLSLFRGVEYVCCPQKVEEELMEEKVSDFLAAEKADEAADLDDDEESDDDDEDDDDDDDDETDESKSKAADTADDQHQDPYFEEQTSANEHERYRDAQERLEKKYRAKVTKVITEWSELFERYNRMKEKDPEGAERYKSEMTARFRKTVASLEDENREWRRELEEVHDERVQAALNERKRKATHEYRLALAIQVGQVNKQNVLRTLKDYIRAEEKDRAHMLNRYRHLLRSNPEGAQSFEPMLLHRLRYIDLRINGTLAMLRDFPELERQVRPAAEEYWQSYRRENTPEVDGRLLEVDGSQPDSNEKLVQLYKEVVGKKAASGTRVESTFNDIMTKSHEDAHKSAETKKSSKIIPLKDILVDKEEKPVAERKQKKEEPAEDLDEDQFDEDDDEESSSEEDEDNEDQRIETSPIVKNETAEALAKAHKLEEQQRIAKIMHAHKLALESGREHAPHHKEAIKAFDLSKAKTVEEEEEADDDDEEEEEKPASKTKNADETVEEDGDDDDDELDDEIFIEPDRLYVRKEVEPSYAKHDQLVAEGIEPHEHFTSGFWSSQTTLLVYIALVLGVLAVAALVLRSRHSRRGFIEVDVCNPDEVQINKMQVHGFENPVHDFYDSKP